MGLLSVGTPLDWDQAKNFSELVRSHGIDQFVNTWLRLKDRHGDELLWGDEVLHRDYLGVLLPSTLIPARCRSSTW